MKKLILKISPFKEFKKEYKNLINSIYELNFILYEDKENFYIYKNNLEIGKFNTEKYTLNTQLDVSEFSILDLLEIKALFLLFDPLLNINEMEILK